MTHLGKQTATLFLLALLSLGLAQSTWAGHISGLPDEATEIGLYVLDFERLMTSDNLGYGDVSQKVAAGELKRDGRFSVETSLEAVQKAGHPLSPRQAFTLSSYAWGEDLTVAPRNAKISMAYLAIENKRGSYIGVIHPQQDPTFIDSPPIFVAHQPVKIEGSVPDPVPESPLVYDVEMATGFNTVKLVGLEPSAPNFVLTSDSRSPQRWVFQPVARSRDLAAYDLERVGTDFPSPKAAVGRLRARLEVILEGWQRRL